MAQAVFCRNRAHGCGTCAVSRRAVGRPVWFVLKQRCHETGAFKGLTGPFGLEVLDGKATA